MPVRGQSLVSFDAVFPPADFSGFGRDLSGEFEADAADLSQGVSGSLTHTTTVSLSVVNTPPPPVGVAFDAIGPGAGGL